MKAQIKKVVHYIGSEQNSKFIIAKTECGKHWNDVSDHTALIKFVTCKKCLAKLNK